MAYRPRANQQKVTAGRPVIMGLIERCPCGDPLHYGDPAAEALIRLTIAELGRAVLVSTPHKGRWRGWCVPRHYYALHGLALDDLPKLARRYRWEVNNDAHKCA